MSSGNVVALHGKETNSGDFLVEDILEAGLPPQLDLPTKSGEDKYVVLVSGLNVGSSSSNPLQLQLLVDHITSHLGDKKEQPSAAEIVQVIVAGNFVQIDHGLLNGQNLVSKDQSKLHEPIKELDIFLTQISCQDRTTLQTLLSHSRSCINPHLFDVGNVRFLGISGQNIDDLEKYSEAKDKLKFMERTLRWRHLAPTAPNTLGCYLFTDTVPFFIKSCPHVYFVGSQVVTVICVPKFSETSIAVMEDLETSYKEVETTINRCGAYFLQTIQHLSIQESLRESKVCSSLTKYIESTISWLDLN
ncbi:unnamed protein product [Lactuca saligna]|uniref:DNA polymerase alpha/delta/epsilon subunit B domain-containing protein n=1 Tax=Lactuca saligna TaxID=75948 RepID=A0AA36E993_LACSI|nr:unnamed protein product [Lactuca saligna]